VPPETEIDQYDESGTHLLLRLTAPVASDPVQQQPQDPKPVGTIRCVRLADPARKYGGAHYWKLSRLAVLKDYRAFGWGRELVHALHDFVRRDAAARAQEHLHHQAVVVSHSQIPVKGFYARWAPLRDPVSASL
jgi:GNAT superfamily N-acetyltransferase